MSEVEYRIVDTEDGEMVLLLGAFTIFKVYYTYDKCRSPVTREKADELLTMLKCILESEYPIESLDSEKYESQLDKFIIKMMKDYIEERMED